MASTKVGARIRDARRKRLMFQRDLAKAANIAERTVSRIETGQNLPMLDTLHKLAPVLGVKPRELADALDQDLAAVAG